MEMKMKVSVLPIAIGALIKYLKSMVKARVNFEIRGELETIQNTASLSSARILRIVLKIVVTCCYLNSSERPPIKTDVKKLV